MNVSSGRAPRSGKPLAPPTRRYMHDVALCCDYRCDNRQRAITKTSIPDSRTEPSRPTTAVATRGHSEGADREYDHQWVAHDMVPQFAAAATPTTCTLVKVPVHRTPLLWLVTTKPT